jgi:NAD-dependent dihydropyrimidine dehydrogenase PreA subunit
VAYLITDLCVDVMDKSCVRECPVDCIYEGRRSMYINPDECIDCGACEMTCPVKAISYEPDLPPEQAHVLPRTREWVEIHGAVGGARRTGPVGVDHPDIDALPAAPAPAP